MYYFMSLLTGILISVMITLNGWLSEFYGIYAATVIVHIVGFSVIASLILIRRERPFAGRYAWPLYLGGAIGVFVAASGNIAFGRISISAILALGLLGQSVMGLIIDQYGLMGMPKHPFGKRKLVGLVIVIAGITSMITSFEAMAVFVSFAAGVGIVLSRTLNAKLSALTSVYIGTFYNYFVGLCLSIPVFLLLGRGEVIYAGFSFSPNIYIYLGGVIGVSVILMSNITVVRISAFYLTLLIFVGQVFSGILIDALLTQAFSPRTIAGGVLVAVGLGVNLVLERGRFGG